MPEALHNPLLIASAIVTGLLVLSWVADRFLVKIAPRLAGLTRSNIDDRLLEILHRPLSISVFFTGLILSLSYIKAPESAVFYTRAVSYTILILVWSRTLIRISNLVISVILNRVGDETGLGQNVIPLISNISRVVLILTAGFLLLSIWRINITPLLASAGIAGAVVAFAAKDTMANVFGGVSIFFDKPFKIGDYIILDSGERGEVVAIGIRSTRIKTRDDVLITIPNSIIANTKIINESAPVPKFRIRIPVSVAYGSDIDLVENTLLEVAASTENVLSEPSPRVRFRSFGDSALNFELLCWAREPSLRGLTLHQLNCSIYKEFDRQGIKIPFPQRDLHIYKSGPDMPS